MKEIARLHPDQLTMRCRVEKDLAGPALSLRFLATQFIRDGISFQHVLSRRITGISSDVPSVDPWSQADQPAEPLVLSSSIRPAVRRRGRLPKSWRWGFVVFMFRLRILMTRLRLYGRLGGSCGLSRCLR